MKPFKMEKKKNARIKIEFGIWWVKQLKNRVDQSYIFHVIIPAHYFFSENLTV